MNDKGPLTSPKIFKKLSQSRIARLATIDAQQSPSFSALANIVVDLFEGGPEKNCALFSSVNQTD